MAGFFLKKLLNKIKFMKDIKAKANPPTKKKLDLQDSADDAGHLENEEAMIDLPDVKGIPGQEHIHIPNMNEFKDATPSSDDEEGKNIWKTGFAPDGVITDHTSNVEQSDK